MHSILEYLLFVFFLVFFVLYFLDLFDDEHFFNRKGGGEKFRVDRFLFLMNYLKNVVQEE